MSQKEKKQLIVAVALLVVAGILMYFLVFRSSGGGAPATDDTTAQAPTGQAPEGAPPLAPGPGGVTATPPGTMPEGTATTGTAAGAQPEASTAGPTLWKARSDPFQPFRKVNITRIPIPLSQQTLVMESPRVPAVTVSRHIIAPPPPSLAILGRAAGILYNNRVYAIYEGADGIGQIVKPGDPVPEGTIMAITPDRVILRDMYGERREVKLKAAEYTTPGGYPTLTGLEAPGGPIMPMPGGPGGRFPGEAPPPPPMG